MAGEPAPDDVNGQDLLGGERSGTPRPEEIARSSAIATGSEPAAGARAPQSLRAARPDYLISLLCGGAFMVLGFFGLLQLLKASGHLPPPAISNNVCIDDKLRFLRDTPPPEPNLLITGSSVAWRGIDGDVLAQTAAGTRPLNGGFCGLKTNQTEFVTGWLLHHYPSTLTVLMLVVPQDFTGCHDVATAVFDPEEADRYVFERHWRWSFYFRYFDPLSLLRNARKIAAQRDNRIPLDPLVFTKTGDGPLDTDVSRSTLGDGAMPAFDGSCFDALRATARSVIASGRRFTVVQMPMKPEWSRRFDAAGDIHADFAAKIDTALSGTGGARWDASTSVTLPESAFTDAIHLRWSAVSGLSRVIAQQVLAHHQT